MLENYLFIRGREERTPKHWQRYLQRRESVRLNQSEYGKRAALFHLATAKRLGKCLASSFHILTHKSDSICFSFSFLRFFSSLLFASIRLFCVYNTTWWCWEGEKRIEEGEKWGKKASEEKEERKTTFRGLFDTYQIKANKERKRTEEKKCENKAISWIKWDVTWGNIVICMLLCCPQKIFALLSVQRGGGK